MKLLGESGCGPPTTAFGRRQGSFFSCDNRAQAAGSVVCSVGSISQNGTDHGAPVAWVILLKGHRPVDRSTMFCDGPGSVAIAVRLGDITGAVADTNPGVTRSSPGVWSGATVVKRNPFVGKMAE